MLPLDLDTQNSILAEEQILDAEQEINVLLAGSSECSLNRPYLYE
jgi:hypothetical protein